MKYALIIILFACSSTMVVNQKLWLCSTIIKTPKENVHVPFIVVSKSAKEARAIYLKFLMKDLPKQDKDKSRYNNSEINTKEDCLLIEEVNKLIINP